MIFLAVDSSCCIRAYSVAYASQLCTSQHPRSSGRTSMNWSWDAYAIHPSLRMSRMRMPASCRWVSSRAKCLRCPATIVRSIALKQPGIPVCTTLRFWIVSHKVVRPSTSLSAPTWRYVWIIVPFMAHSSWTLPLAVGELCTPSDHHQGSEHGHLRTRCTHRTALAEASLLGTVSQSGGQSSVGRLRAIAAQGIWSR